MFYKNITGISKKFHGVIFPPGEIREVSINIDHPDMILVSAPTDTENIKSEKSQNKNINNNKEAKTNGSDSSK